MYKLHIKPYLTKEWFKVYFCYSIYLVICNYFYITLPGINAHLHSIFVEAFFSEFCPAGTEPYAQLMDSVDDIKSEVAQLWGMATADFNVYLSSWAVDYHRVISDKHYFIYIYNRLELCSVALSFSSFADWLDFWLIKVQPITPWCFLYEPYPECLFGADCLTYKSFVRRGAWLLLKICYGRLLNEEEKDQLLEFMTHITAALHDTMLKSHVYSYFENVPSVWDHLKATWPA